MPVHRSKDGYGPCYHWGDQGKKHHYEPGSKESREAAKERARRQGRAARERGHER